MKVISIPYELAGLALRRELAHLNSRAVGDDASDFDAPVHPQHPYAQSFFLRDNLDCVISYAAVLPVLGQSGGQLWAVGGLSCVMTEPALRRQGHGTHVATFATKWLELSNLDLGAFTCDPALSRFFARIGWPVVPGMVLVGNKRPGALRSDALGKVVLLRCFSPRAKENCAALATSMMVLDLPEGEFL